MSEDREVLREVWDGKLPTAFTLSSDEVVTSLPPETYYLMLPRNSYFPLATEKVKKHFSKFIANEDDSTIWFSFEGTPLKLHLPIGVIYDQLKMDPSKLPFLGPPWKLTVHFSNFPQEDLLKITTKDEVEKQFMSCVKEADQFKHGGRIMSTMQKKDHHQLWLGLANDKFDQFWAVNRRLMEKNEVPTANANAGDDPEAGTPTFKHIPVRMYKAETLLALKLVKPFVKSDQMDRLATFQDLIQEYFPGDEQVQALTQGIEPDADTPLQWMSEHLSYPDNFLHVVVK